MHPRQRLAEVAVALVGDDHRLAGLGDQHVGAGDADLGLEILLAQHAARFGQQRGELAQLAVGVEMGVRLAERGLDLGARVTWTAGAMMWLGISPRSWMMYSPRSVSTGGDAVLGQEVVDPAFLGDHRLALVDRLRARLAADVEHDALRVLGGLGPVHHARRSAITWASYASR